MAIGSSFVSYRQSYTHHPTQRSRVIDSKSGRYTDDEDASERAGLMSGLDEGGDTVIEMDLFPPRWADIQDEVSQTLSDVQIKMKRLEVLHAKHVLPGFDDETVKFGEAKEIESLTQDIATGFSACQRAIKRVDILLAEQRHQQDGVVSGSNATIAHNLKINLATSVEQVSSLFRKRQAAYLRKLRGPGVCSSPTDRSIMPLAQSPYIDPAVVDEEADRSSAQSTLQQTAQVRSRNGVLDVAIARREREIERIAQGVLDLSSIFQEMNSMVIDQGSLLDRIDYNVERTAQHVQAAEKELTVATGHQRKSTKRKIILLLILLVAAMFIALLFKPSRRPRQPISATAHRAATGSRSSRGGTGRNKNGGGSPFDIGSEPHKRSTSAPWKRRRRRPWKLNLSPSMEYYLGA